MRHLRTADLSAIQKLVAVGMSSEDIKAHIDQVNAGGEAQVSFSPGASKPKTVQAYSFLRDANQYNGQYHVSHEEAANLLDKLAVNPTEVTAAIHKIVSEADSRKRGNPRAVRVVLDGAPSGKIPGAPAAGDDGGYKVLGEIIRGNSSMYGFYSFAAHDRNIVGPEQFEVDLGGGLVVLGQSKKVVTRAAQIVSAEGRFKPEVAGYVHMKGPNGIYYAASNIPTSFWDGRRGPCETKPRDPDVDELAALLTRMSPANLRGPGAAEESDDESDDEEEAGKAAKPAQSTQQRPASPAAQRKSPPPSGAADKLASPPRAQ